MRNINLLKGSPFKTLTKLALPIMATSLVQMAYNLTDMFWIGGLGSSSVAAVGSAGMFLWFSEGLSIIPRMGGQVISAQSLGESNFDKDKKAIRASIQIGLLLGLLFTLISIFARKPMIGIFALNETATISNAELYLGIVSFGYIPSFLARIWTGLLTAGGNSHTSFRVTVIGLVCNMILDPLFIYAFKLGVAGAALATVLSQIAVCVLFYIAIRKNERFIGLEIYKVENFEIHRKILKIGIPAGIQTMLYSSASMLLARLVALFGDGAVAVQRIGGQIESITWMISDSLSSAINAYTAQNFGAKNIKRLHQGYRAAFYFSCLIGAVASIILFFFPKPIMSLFFHEIDIIEIGVSYLVVHSFSQIFMSLEIMNSGAFSGYGQTLIPSVTITIFTLLRLPLAYILSNTNLGLDGIWWSVSLSSIAKGLILFVWFIIFQNRKLHRLSN